MPVPRVKTSAKARPATRASGLILVGVYKLVEGFLLLAVGFGMLRLLHKDLAAVVLHWAHVMRIDPDNHYIHKLLVKVFAVNPKQLKELSAGTFCYAALRLLEGFGLVLRRRWAEYLTAAATALFIPLEVYEIVRRFTPLKVGVLAVNVAIVWYLIASLRKGR